MLDLSDIRPLELNDGDLCCYNNKIATVIDTSDEIYTLQMPNQPDTRCPLNQISMPTDILKSNVRSRLSNNHAQASRLLKGFTFYISLSTHTDDGKRILN